MNIAAPTVVFVVILVEGFLEILTMSAVWHTIIVGLFMVKTIAVAIAD